MRAGEDRYKNEDMEKLIEKYPIPEGYLDVLMDEEKKFE